MWRTAATEALASRLESEGIQVVTGVTARGVRRKNGAVIVETEIGGMAREFRVSVGFSIFLWYADMMSTINYLDSMLNPVVESFTPAVARKIVDLRADARLEQRVDELRQKANEGTLTPDEDAEYRDFVESVDIISILQAKARRFLADRAL